MAQQTEHFEKYFATPHEFRFAQAAAMFSLDYAAPDNMDSLQQSFDNAVTSTRPALIEVKTDPG